MADFTQAGALLVDTFGSKLLEYLLAVEPDRLAQRLRGASDLSEAQERVLAQLLDLAAHFATAPVQSDMPMTWRLGALGRFDEAAGTSIGNALRVHAGGRIDLGPIADPVAATLSQLLLDVYPLMLVPGDPTVVPWQLLSSAVFMSPRSTAFGVSLLADPDLSRLFVDNTEDGGWTSMTYRSTGVGGTLQLWNLPSTLLTSAWWRARLSGTTSPDAVAAELPLLCDILRRAVRGEPCTIRVLVAFAGVVFDDAVAVSVPFGGLRAMRDWERDLAPPALEGSVSRRIADDERITASYAGDIVLDTTIEYRIHTLSNDDDTPVGQRDLHTAELLASNIETARLGSLLASADDTLLGLAPTWRVLLDPLEAIPLQYSSDPRSKPRIHPQRLPSQTANDLAHWITRVHEQRRPYLDVAVKRTISAFSSRIDPADALVDLVIAWENLTHLTHLTRPDGTRAPRPPNTQRAA